MPGCELPGCDRSVYSPRALQRLPATSQPKPKPTLYNHGFLLIDIFSIRQYSIPTNYFWAERAFHTIHPNTDTTIIPANPTPRTMPVHELGRVIPPIPGPEPSDPDTAVVGIEVGTMVGVAVGVLVGINVLVGRTVLIGVGFGKTAGKLNLFMVKNRSSSSSAVFWSLTNAS